MNQAYKHSGNFTATGIIAGMVAGLVGGFPLAFIYAWGVIRIPEIKLACIATMAYGALVGVVAVLGMKWGKVRNARVAALVAIATAAGSLYWSWAFWVKDVFHTYGQKELNAFVLMQRPSAIWELVKLINQYGTWGMSKDSATTGTALWIIWALEAVTVLCTAALAAAALLEMQPFCESCKLWCSATEKLCFSPVNDLGPIQQSLQQHDLSFLQKLGAGNKKTTHLSAELHSCKNCGELNTLTLQQTFIQPRKFGAPNVKAVSLAKKLLISRQEAGAFRQTAHSIEQLSKAAGT